MSRENSQTRPTSNDKLALQVQLVHEADIGHLDNLICPNCRHEAISVWFTHPAPDVYRTWFICADCDFHTRVQDLKRPTFFSDDRVSTELEERDLAIVRQSIFKRPPQRPM